MAKILVAEKPLASKRIAEALAEGKLSKKRSKYDVTYYEFERNGEKHIVIPAVGHLFTLKQKGEGWTYPVFEASWTPSFKAKKESKFSEKYFRTMERISKKGTDYVVCCDYDAEGSLIGANVVRLICGQNDAKRMKFSTLTKSDLIEAYENMSPHLDFGLIAAGEARHLLDWIYGINTTRALTIALNKKGDFGFQILSAGRVQAPTLDLLLKKDKQIRKFEPVPFWQIELETEFEGKKITALHVKDKFWKESEAKKIVEKCKGKPPKVTKIRRWKYKQKPPIPFNLTNLQTEAYRFFGYTPDRTLNIAQALYTSGHISYPRTRSQKLPPKVNYNRILKALTKLKKYKKLAKDLLKRKELSPREGKKADRAHVSIYPTHEPPKKKLKGSQKKIYDLICRRFMATFAKPAIRETMKVTIEISKEEFKTKGRRTLERNWHKFYGPYAKFKEIILPDLKKGDELKLKDIKLLDKETKPPARYSPASLVKLMDEKGLGTRATRSSIVRILFDRGYLRGKSIEVTKLGETVVEILKEYCPKITSVELTREFEEKIEKVREGKLKKEEVVEEAKQVLSEILKGFKEREDEIGEKLAKSFKKAQKADSYLGKCPKCGNDLRVIYSKKTHKRFAGCSGFFKGVCDFSSALPQRGRIQSTEMECKYCGYPMVMVFSKGRKRPWFLCLNTQCPNKKSRKK